MDVSLVAQIRGLGGPCGGALVPLTSLMMEELSGMMRGHVRLRLRCALCDKDAGEPLLLRAPFRARAKKRTRLKWCVMNVIRSHLTVKHTEIFQMT